MGKKNKDVFPPQPQPRKEDLQMESGEYFLNEQERQAKQRRERLETQKLKTTERKRERAKEFEAPTAQASSSTGKKRKGAGSTGNEGVAESAKDLAEKIVARTAASKRKKKEAKSLLL